MIDGARILVADDDEAMRDSCRQALEREGVRVAEAASGDEALRMLSDGCYSLLLLDLKMPGKEGLKVLEEVRSEHPRTAVVVITGYASVDTAVEAMKRGATDFLPKPFSRESLTLMVRKALEHHNLQRENRLLREELGQHRRSTTMVGRTPEMQEVFGLIEQVAPTDSTVLVTGESGTGKELVARALHAQSNRSDGPFVVVDCATLVGNLFENELFGHAKGSYTGADKTTHGRFELADGGTLFLDEVGCIELGMQQKLLRVLEERQFTRVGSNEVISVDVRMIAATNIVLAESVQAGKFREDLYYRLSVFPIRLPPLRQRRADIPRLAEHFMRLHARNRGKPMDGIDEEALQALRRHHWPGNVRELSNVIERAVVLAKEGRIRARHVLYNPAADGGPDESPEEQVASLAEVEKQHIVRVLQKTEGNKRAAADLLGIDRKTLYRKLQRYEDDG
ncbi:MAG: sigma-54-dependent transcriptional regulator [Planctomycetota bacterium]